MPGAPGRPPGRRRRGSRRPPRTGGTPRSRRSATRRPHRAGPVRSRRGWLMRPAPCTGASRSAGRGRRPRAGTASRSPPRGSGSARLALHKSSASAATRRNTSPGKVLSRGCKGARSLISCEMSASRASPSSSTRRAVTVSSGPGRLAGMSRRYGGPADRWAVLPADRRRAGGCPRSWMTHLNRLICPPAERLAPVLPKIMASTVSG
jgi:hypothetical protein